MRTSLIVRFVVLVGVFVISATAFGQPGQSAIIAIPMEESTDRALLEELRLPVYHEFEGALVVGATQADMNRLVEARIPFTILDDAMASGSLYLVAPRKNRAMPATIGGSRTLWQDQSVRLVRMINGSRLSGSEDLAAVPLDRPIGTYTAVRYQVGATMSAARDSLLKGIVAEVNADSIRAVIQALQDFGTRYAYATNRKSVSGWIRDRFLSIGYTDAVLDSFQYGGTWQWNVVATLAGTLHPDQLLVIGGHHDSNSQGNPNVAAPGADDNASGTAAVLEIARVLKRKGVVPELTISFATFAAEEVGLVGGEVYADRLGASGANVALMINHDMISHDRRPPGSQIMDINWYAGSEAYRDHAIQMAKRVSTVSAIVGSKNSAGSDSYPFWAAGFPAVYFEENWFSPYYHSQADTIGNYNMPYCAEIIRTSCALAITRALAPPAVANFQVVDPGDGHWLRATWSPTSAPDAITYIVYRGQGIAPGRYDTSWATLGTEAIIDGLTDGVMYTIGVSVVDAQGFESPVAERPVTPRSAPQPPMGLYDDPQHRAIVLRWSPNVELDLHGYHVHRTTDTTQVPVRLTAIVLTDTLYADTTAMDGVRYFYAVTAVDSSGNEGGRSSYIRSSVASLNQGILVVDETRNGSGALLTPTDAQVDAFYREMVIHFAPRTADVDSLVTLKLADLGPFSSVVWHGNDLTDKAAAVRSRDAIRRYLQAGGKLLLTCYNPSQAFISGETYPATFAAGSFTYDMLKISHAENLNGARCSGALPAAPGYPELRFDSTKTTAAVQYNLIRIEGCTAAPAASVIYTYDTPYDTGTAQGKMKGLPVGIEYLGTDYKLVVTSIPLYYVRTGDARSFVEYVLGTRFGEPSHVADYAIPVPSVTALLPNYPNPFNPVTKIGYTIAESKEKGVGSRDVKLVVYDVLGREVALLVSEKKAPGRYEVEFDASGLASGVYFYRLTSGASVESRKMVLMK